MTTIKMRVLTEVREKRSRNGGIYFGVTGITSDSKIAVCYVNEEHREKLTKSGHYVIHRAKTWPKAESLHVKLLNETKVIIVLLSSVVHCVLSRVHNV